MELLWLNYTTHDSSLRSRHIVNLNKVKEEGGRKEWLLGEGINTLCHTCYPSLHSLFPVSVNSITIHPVPKPIRGENFDSLLSCMSHIQTTRKFLLSSPPIYTPLQSILPFFAAAILVQVTTVHLSYCSCLLKISVLSFLPSAIHCPNRKSLPCLKPPIGFLSHLKSKFLPTTFHA